MIWGEKALSYIAAKNINSHSLLEGNLIFLN